MPERRPYLLRIPSDLMDELTRWAKDDLRSLNGQIEFVLREAVRRRRGQQDKPSMGIEDSEAT